MLGQALKPLSDKCLSSLGVSRDSKPYHIFEILRTCAAVCFGMIIFRSESLSQAASIVLLTAFPAPGAEPHSRRAFSYQGDRRMGLYDTFPFRPPAAGCLDGQGTGDRASFVLSSRKTPAHTLDRLYAADIFHRDTGRIWRRFRKYYFHIRRILRRLSWEPRSRH